MQYYFEDSNQGTIKRQCFDVTYLFKLFMKIIEIKARKSMYHKKTHIMYLHFRLYQEEKQIKIQVPQNTLWYADSLRLL